MGLFGQALLDFYHHVDPEPFYICDEQKDRELDLRFYLTPRPAPLEATLLGRVMGRCLDIGCGAGRILRYLDSKGQAAMGIDIDPLLIQLCRELGCRTAHLGSWEELEQFGRFDTFLLLNRSIGIAGDMAGAKRLLALCAAGAPRGGRLIFDSYEITNPTGVLERKLRYKYRGQYSEPFPWVQFSSQFAGKLLTETGWLLESLTREEDRYGIVARRTAAP
jgi:SAM-dependent methyltransferase